MKVQSYATDINLNRKYIKNVYKNEKIRIFGKRNGELFFSYPNDLQTYGLFTGYDGLNAPPIFLRCIGRP